MSKIKLLPLTIEALREPANEAAGKALAYTIGASSIIDHAKQIEAMRVDTKLSNSLSVGMEAVLLTGGPGAGYTGHSVIGSKVTYRFTKDGWRVVSIKRETRFPGQSAKVNLVVSDKQAAEIQRRAIADLIVRKAA